MKNKLRTLLLLFICQAPLLIHAQSGQQDLRLFSDESAPSSNPLPDEAAIKAKLFELPDGQINYNFQVRLPDHNFLLIRFSRLSYWPGKPALADMFAAAQKTAESVSGSFPHPGSSKKIALHIPIANTPVTVSLTDHYDGSRLIVLDNGVQAPLKAGMDTISILKTFAVHDSDLVQIQYQFVLKDLGQINTLAANETLINGIEQQLDSLVATRRKKWHSQDAWFHQLTAVDDPAAAPSARMKVTRSTGFRSTLEGDFNISASYVYNRLLVSGSDGITFKFPDNYSTGFLKLSMSEVNLIDQVNSEIKTGRIYFINLEAGQSFDSHKHLSLHHLSIGAGYRIEKDGDLATDYQWHIYAGCGISRLITLSPDFYFTPKQPNGKKVEYAGLTLAFRFL